MLDQLQTVATITGVIVWILIASSLVVAAFYIACCAWYSLSVHYWQFRCAVRENTVRDLMYWKLPRSLLSQFIQFARMGLGEWQITQTDSGATWYSPTKYTLPPAPTEASRGEPAPPQSAEKGDAE